MANIELVKTNAYAAVTQQIGHIQLAKTNAYGVALNVTGHTLIAKINAYASALNVPGHELLAKVNAYAVVNDELGVQGIHVPLLDLEETEVFLPELESSILPKFELREMERNPYRPHMADRDEDRWRDFAEQQRIIRQQHNITQGGDTTFDYGLLLKAYPNEEFTLGSLGRFFHDDFGIILARFVQFKDWVDHPIQGQPVGRMKFNNSKGVNWVVTNDFTKSSADLAFGFCFLAQTPADDTYGWAVVSGPNPAQIKNLGSQVPDQNAPYVWAETGAIQLGGRGRIIGRKWGTSTRAGLPAGSLFIHPEGMSILDLVDTVRSALTELTQIDTILDQLEAADERASRALANSLEVEADLLTLTNNFGGQIDRLGNLIASLSDPFDWGPVIAAGDAASANALNLAVTQLSQTINNLTNRVTAIENRLNVVDLIGMAETIQNIIEQLALIGEKETIFLPLVSGGIPPTFIQTGDGGLVYIRIQ